MNKFKYNTGDKVTIIDISNRCTEFIVVGVRARKTDNEPLKDWQYIVKGTRPFDGHDAMFYDEYCMNTITRKRVYLKPNCHNKWFVTEEIIERGKYDYC